jgi:hypothetical protein
MPLHLLKLCVGADSVADLEGWIARRSDEQRRAGQVPEHGHTTRMTPKRAAELLDGGSLYWVIRGQVAARQRLLALRSFTDGDGIGRCHLVLQPDVVAVAGRPCRPFQGWRYLEAVSAPPDAGRVAPDLAALPDAVRRELRDLGLI